MKLIKSELKEFLEEKYEKFNCPDFIDSDPVSIPHQFTQKDDIEIAGFLAATIAWGQRVTIINNAKKLMKLMNNTPYDFILNATKKDFSRFENFVHRTFNSEDCIYFIKSLQNIYRYHGGLEIAFTISSESKPQKENLKVNSCRESIAHFRELFFSISHPQRSTKHVSDPIRNSSAKRLCMYLRWMVRNDNRGVDFGIWKNLNTKHLMCPLDVHSGNVARKLGLLKRVQNDWKAVEELTGNLRSLDVTDPVKYDFALFGLGVFEKF